MRIDGNDAGTRSRAATALAMGLGHTTFALQFRGERVVMRRRDHAGDQIGDGSADHSGLAEGGEHLIDVMQEVELGPTTSTPERSSIRRCV